MRLIKLLIFIFLPFCVAASPAPAPSAQVRVNGRIATFESVLNYCGGDTAAAVLISTPLPVAAPYLSRARVKAERLYNLFNPGWICAIAAVLCLLLPASRFIAFLLLLLLSGGFALRWWLGEGLPLVGITDVAGAIAVVLGVTVLLSPSMRRLVCPVIAILMCCMAIWGTHPAVRAVNPALQSLWLPVHVCLMVVAYSFFLISAISAATGIPGNATLRCIIGGVASLAAGIAIGSVWAAEAWGSYWSWDPKETAALVTLLVYIGVAAAWGKLRQNVAFLRGVVICAFVAVVFTWIGVSGGLHSY